MTSVRDQVSAYWRSLYCLIKQHPFFTIAGGLVTAITFLLTLYEAIEETPLDLNIPRFIVTGGCEGNIFGKLECNQNRGKAIIILENRSSASGDVRVEIVFIKNDTRILYTEFPTDIFIDAHEEWLTKEVNSRIIPDKIEVCLHTAGELPWSRIIKKFELTSDSASVENFMSGSTTFEGDPIARESSFFGWHDERCDYEVTYTRYLEEHPVPTPTATPDPQKLIQDCVERYKKEGFYKLMDQASTFDLMKDGYNERDSVLAIFHKGLLLQNHGKADDEIDAWFISSLHEGCKLFHDHSSVNAR